MKIGGIDTDKEVMIIAEVGNNHEGSFALAEELIGCAAEAGAHAVKFQTFKTEHYISSKDEARFKRLKSFELTYDEFSRLAQTARELGIAFISTPFDLYSAEFLSTIVDAFKIASGDNTFYPLIEKVAGFDQPVVVSTGIADLAEIQKTVSLIENIRKAKNINAELAILHCITSYPVQPDEANLAAILTFKNHFSQTIGYSDHTLGIDACVIAAALGARIIEKHFTIDKNYSDFRDHQLSADPAELKMLVQKIREVSVMLGSGEKIPQESEKNIAAAVRRSIVAAKDISAGATIDWKDITWTRPAGGVAPGDESLLLGKKLRRSMSAGEMITQSDVE